MIDGSIIHSAPYLSAKAPTIGPQKNVGAAAATEGMRLTIQANVGCQGRTIDKPDEIGILVPKALHVQSQPVHTVSNKSSHTK